MSGVCGFIVALAIFCGIISIIWWLIAAIMKKNIKIPFRIGMSCVVVVIVFTIIGTVTWTKTDEYQEYLKEKVAEDSEKAEQESQEEELARLQKQEISENEEQIETESESTDEEIEAEPQFNEQENETEELRQESTEVNSIANVKSEETENVFYENLSLDTDKYDGRTVVTTVIVSSCVNLKKEYYITSSMDANSNNIKIYTDSENDFDSGEYITVKGIVDIGDYDEVQIKDSEIMEIGDAAKQNWEDGMENYIEEFKAVAEKPTYDDLMRYPDSYNESKVVVSITITKVEPDGMIFDGKIQATMNGEEILISDGRENREPRLQEGDMVTIYGFGKGLATVKEYDKSGIIPKVVNKYNIPEISIRYLEF